jgi:hypothetical protein
MIAAVVVAAVATYFIVTFPKKISAVGGLSGLDLTRRSSNVKLVSVKPKVG